MRRLAILGLFLAVPSGCGREEPPTPPPVPASTGHEDMVALLKTISEHTLDEHYWLGDYEIRALEERLERMSRATPAQERFTTVGLLGIGEGRHGDFDAAAEHLAEAERLLPRVEHALPDSELYTFFLESGLVWLRLGEVRNCVARHSGESCIMPIRGRGIHVDTTGSRKALEYFRRLAERFPDRHTPGWMLNIAHMTLGEFPDKVPAKYRIPPGVIAPKHPFPRFVNVAPELGLATFGLCGSVVIEDFDGDGLLDAAVSSWDPRVRMWFFHNDGDGHFSDRTEQAGLQGMLGGANMMQTDYNNDGHPDLYVLRGTWLDRRGRHPNSLLRNNGDGTFTDVTFEAGLGEAHYPTETGGWSDYDNDGDLDLFVGNEYGDGFQAPCQLFRNNGDGTFTDVASRAGVINNRYAKGVSWGDFNGDGFEDLFVSNLRGGYNQGGPALSREGRNRLYRNNGDGTFTDIAEEAGVTRPMASYSAWFWDFDNDGRLDLYVPSYQGGVEVVAAAYMGKPLPEGTELPCLYRGDGKGGFTEVAGSSGLTMPVMSMGANFGDLDNDGRLDFYLGTGYPEYEAVMPNVMYHNVGGRRFEDVTFHGGFGHLQKGHGVAFADLDNDGDQDVFEQLGGAFPGDGAMDAVFRNPGFGNHWIKLKLVGTRSNRAAIGAKIRLDINDGAPRSIYRRVGSGGSFGANPLRQEIGIGKATVIGRVEIVWPASGITQIFTNVAPDRFLRITEGTNELEEMALPRVKR